VLFVGRICRTKNLPALLEAVRPLDNVHLTIAGPDDNDGTSEAMAPLLAAMGDRVAVRGWVDAQTRDALIDAADIAVLPSMTENCGNYAAEAAARRRPVVVTSAAGIAGFLGDAAVVVDPTVDGLRAGIARMAADPTLRALYAERAFERVGALAPEEVAAAQERIYYDALRCFERRS
jgi:glycosyltransferase involved in cell wall biosynthesis